MSKLVTVSDTKDGNVAFELTDTNPEQLAQEVEAFFTGRGYRLESGDKLNGAWGVGNDVMRILFGAFVKRFKFQIAHQVKDGGITLTFAKGMNGASGGVIGYAKMNTETAAIRKGLETHFGGASAQA